MDWQKLLIRFDWLGHIIEAICIAIAVALMFIAIGADLRGSLVIGGTFAVGHFHGREKRDYEVSVGMRPPHLKAYLLWRWSKDQLTDFLPVLAVFFLFLIVIFA